MRECQKFAIIQLASSRRNCVSPAGERSRGDVVDGNSKERGSGEEEDNEEDGEENSISS